MPDTAIPTSLHSPSRQARWRRSLVVLNLVVLAFVIRHFILNPPMPTSGGGEPDSAATTAMKREVYASIAADDAIGFTRLDPANPGGWLLGNKEELQPLWIYQRQTPRPTASCRTIVIQPLGTMNAEQKKLVDDLREYTSIFFQLPARVEKPLALNVPPAWVRGKLSNRAGQGQQYDADHLVFDFLAPRKPPDAVAYLGITMSDLWSGEGNFVFGIGSPTHHTGVYSLCRYYPEFWHHPHRRGEAMQALRRACKVLNHEVGHIFGLGHCVFYHCSMNGSNSLGEADAAPIDYCPVCHRKLLWNIGFDGVKRYSELLAFYRKHGMGAEATWTAGRLQRWKQIAAREVGSAKS